MSTTSWRSLRLLPDLVLSSMRVSSVVFWRSLASGCAANSSSSSESISSSLSTSESSESVLRRLEASSGSAHSGVGFMRWNCRRSRRIYSVPLMISSDSVLRSLRSLDWLTRETAMRSSSLSCHTAGADSSSSSSSEGVSGDSIRSVVCTSPESRKKS